MQGRARAKPRTLVGKLWCRIIALHGSPEQIALGAAIGVLVALSPTIGLQMIIAAFIATAVNASRPAAVIPVWITNPLTIPPVYAFTYYVGSFFWPGPDAPISEVYDVFQKLVTDLASESFWEVLDQFRRVLALGGELFLPMVIGGLVVGLPAAGVTYFATLFAVRRFRAGLHHLTHRRD